MGKWLHSGRRRDVCLLLYRAGERRGQTLKADLSAHYDERIDPADFYATMAALVDAGFVEKDTDGLHDVYRLSAGGRKSVVDHYEWVTDCIEAGESEGESESESERPE